jgi:hypothetical protein
MNALAFTQSPLAEELTGRDALHRPRTPGWRHYRRPGARDLPIGARAPERPLRAALSNAVLAERIRAARHSA